MPEGGVTWRIATPASSPGAIAVVELVGSATELARALETLGIRAPGTGELRLADLCGIDRGIVAAWSSTCVHLMPHGGVVVVRELAAALLAAGIGEGADETASVADRYPESRDEDEALILAAIARTRSPRALDLLLDQPRRWSSWRSGQGPGPQDSHSRVLDRLLHPPLVAAVGATNIGKSSLTNALAGEPVSIVADEPGTTRDHVGATILVDGLAVRFVDTPGIRPSAPEEESQAAELAWRVVAGADLVLLCGDGASAPARPRWLADGPVVVTVALRSDLGVSDRWRADVTTSTVTGEGVNELAVRVRERLVPDAALTDPRPWRPGLWTRARGG